MELYRLFQGRDYKIVPTLDRIMKAAEYAGLSPPSYPSIQIGGTNGKGSTCAFVERILREHGLKTGWFVSPHLVEERERWRVNGQYMPQERLREYVKELSGIIERFELTYFEACTLLALRYFEDEKVDVAVFEVGMGGRWDATKVCMPVVCAITNVERDHVRWLGTNPESRAEEKLGIYREGFPLVLGSMRYPLYPKALELCRQEDLVVAGVDFQAYGKVEGDTTLLESFVGERLKISNTPLGLWGKWQIGNAGIALAVVERFIQPEEEKVKRALTSTRWEGRMEILRRKPLLMVDGAHNVDSIKKVVQEVKKHIKGVVPVFSALRDKEWEESITFLRTVWDRIYLVPIKHHRGEDISRLLQKARELNFKEIVLLESAVDVVSLKEDLLVIGSLYLVGEVKEAFSSVYREA